MICKTAKPLTSNQLLLVEGNDDYEFLQRLIKFSSTKKFEFIIIGGKPKLRSELEALPLRTGFNNIKSFAIILDADRNRIKTINHIKKCLASANFSPPPDVGWDRIQDPNIGYFLLPNNSGNGDLEDLYISTISNDPVITCIDKYFDCVKSLGLRQKKISKAKVQVYLASKLKPTKSLEKAAQDNQWDFASKKLNDIKTFLSPMF